VSSYAVGLIFDLAGEEGLLSAENGWLVHQMDWKEEPAPIWDGLPENLAQPGRTKTDIVKNKEWAYNGHV
jgi:hypothetical protein